VDKWLNPIFQVFFIYGELNKDAHCVLRRNITFFSRIFEIRKNEAIFIYTKSVQRVRFYQNNHTLGDDATSSEALEWNSRTYKL